jgi:OFA family oxalate/formate antiporter-like MFS transporter
MIHMQKKEINRWLLIPNALLIQICLGSLYVYSFYKPFLGERFPNWNSVDLALPSQLVVAFFTIGILISGKLQDKYNPRLLSTIGGGLLGLGLIIASLSTNLTMFVIGFGIIGGFGIGSSYVCPVATVIKWFPDKPGLINGISVAGFGGGALIFTPVAKMLIGWIGIMDTFLVLGIIYFLFIVIGSRMLIVPPPDYKPKGWEQDNETNPTKSGNEFTSLEMLRTYQFKILSFTYFACGTSGLLLLMNVTNIWQSYSLLDLASFNSIIKRSLFEEVISMGAIAVITVSILNALGRIFWGRVSDKLGRRNTITVMFFISMIAIVSLIFMKSFFLFLLGASIIGFCSGGFSAIYSVLIADYFGTKNLGSNYGWLTISWGLSGLVGPYIAPKLMTVIQKIPYEVIESSGAISIRYYSAGSYYLSLCIAAALCLISAVLFLSMKPPVKNNNSLL